MFTDNGDGRPGLPVLKPGLVWRPGSRGLTEKVFLAFPGNLSIFLAAEPLIRQLGQCFGGMEQ